MNDVEFFAKLADYVEDAMPERMIVEKFLMQRIFQIIRHEDPRQNFTLFSILRAWCRKIAVRINIETDKRLRVGPFCDIRKSIAPVCQMFTEKLIPFFKIDELLPLVCETCYDLLTVANISASHSLVDICMQKMSQIKPLMIPLLRIVATSNSIVDGLPLLDPVIALRYPKLHKKLSKIAPDDFREQIEQVQSVISKINAINNCEIEIDRDLLEYCNLQKLVSCSPPDIFITHPSPAVRIAFYKYARDKRIDIHPFLEPLLCYGLFDSNVREYAISLVSIKLPTLVNPPLSDNLLAHLQCMPMEKDGDIFKSIIDVIEYSDNLTYFCSCIRFLYHKHDWVRETIKKILTSTIGIKSFPDVFKQPEKDFYVKKFMKNLEEHSNIPEKQVANNLLSIILSNDHPLDIKRISAEKMISMLLDPYCDVRSILPSLYNLELEDYPELMHALAIRDGNFRITDIKRLRHLVEIIDEKNYIHLLPVLTRFVFWPFLRIESDGANLLRLPAYLEDQFIIHGIGGNYKPKFYQPTKTFPLIPIVKEWIGTNLDKHKPINEKFDYKLYTSLVICNKNLGKDILDQIDSEDSAAAKLSASVPPHNLLYLMLLCVLAAKRSSNAAKNICEKYIADAPGIGLKLAQVLVEYGSDVQTPEKITDYIIDPSTKRAALSFIVTKMNFKKPVEGIDFEKLKTLYDEEQPINVKRQLAVLLLLQEKGELGAKFAELKDPITKSFGFHTAISNSENAALALCVSSHENEAICARASALELFNEFCHSNPPPSDNLAGLYHISTGETIFSLELLKMLQVPAIRAQVSKANEFILSFLTPTSSPLFVNCALQCLLGIDYDSAEIADALTNLLQIPQYTDHVLQVLASTPDRSLSYFNSDIHDIICSTLKKCDLNLAFVCINHLLLIGIPFPESSVIVLINLYRSFLEASCCSSALHTILPQIFNTSPEAKVIALENGFPDLLLSELNVARENITHFNCVILTASEFVFGFREGQMAIAESWKLDTLIDIFQPTSEVLHFFLCLASRNIEIESLFAQEIGSESILGRSLEAFDSVQLATPQVIRLLACLMHSGVIRRVIYRKKKVKAFVSRLIKYVSTKNWQFAESMIRLFVVLTFYVDGIDSLLDSTQISELLEILMENEEIIQMDIFSLFAHNLKGHTKTWPAVQQSFKKYNKKLFEIFMEIVSDDSIYEQP
ncbi:hypothetical protein M9Y10_029258 [Tritrichomonas musculus]|uniref:Uncharacterized protein n=1 Tax=Tritrichomonas musculus TaxID=1915356 RepID=A0ABR2KMI0_9EUKA